MTAQEKNEYVATEIMGWKKEQRPSGKWWWVNSENHGVCYVENYLRPDYSDMDFGWNPLKDWNDFRRLEEKVMTNVRLWERFIDYVTLHAIPHTYEKKLKHYMFSDLPDRIDALISAHQSLLTSV